MPALSLMLALLRLFDLLAFSNLGDFVDRGSLSGIERVLLLNYALFFVFLFVCGAVTLYLIILAALREILPRLFTQEASLRMKIISLWSATIIYYCWLVRSRLLLVRVIPGFVVIIVYAFMLGVLTLLIIRILREREPYQLRIFTLSALGGIFIFRGAFFLLDAAFFTPLTEKNLPGWILGLGSSLGLGVLMFSLLRTISYRKMRADRRLQWVLIPAFLLGVIIALTAIAGLIKEEQSGTNTNPARPIRNGKKMNLILIVIDALRADHLGCYGYPRETTPHLDALANEGIRFEECYAPVSWTKPSVASLMTSLYPGVHGAVRAGDSLPGEVVTLAELLRAAGWTTAGFITNPHLKSIYNFNQGFDLFDDSLTRDKIYEIAIRQLVFYPLLRAFSGKNFNLTDRDRANLVNRKVFSWLEREKDSDFFAYIHYMDPHAPYNPPGKYREMFPAVSGNEVSRTVSLYDGEIRFVDNAVGELLERLKALGIYQRTVILVTADHGEAFGEHGDFGHGHTIYQDQLRVPLIIKCPSCPPALAISSPVSTLDILPTLLDLMNLHPDPAAAGVSLMGMIKENEPIAAKDSDLYFDLENFNGSAIIWGVIKAGRWKYIRTGKSPLRGIKRDGEEELYDLKVDPGEINNLLRQKTEMMEILRKKLDNFRERFGRKNITTPAVEPDRETRDQIRALGYM